MYRGVVPGNVRHVLRRSNVGLASDNLVRGSPEPVLRCPGLVPGSRCVVPGSRAVVGGSIRLGLRNGYALPGGDILVLRVTRLVHGSHPARRGQNEREARREIVIQSADITESAITLKKKNKNKQG